MVFSGCHYPQTTLQGFLIVPVVVIELLSIGYTALHNTTYYRITAVVGSALSVFICVWIVDNAPTWKCVTAFDTRVMS